MTYLLLLTAIALSGIAAYYSIAGLCAIFAAAVVPVAIMGSALEVSKLVVASWLYRNWDVTPRLLRSYFTTAIVVLMLLTSMGIFGFLSKAHVDQNLVSGDVVAKLSILDEQIKTEKENINESRKIITQLDLQVNETISRSAGDNTSSSTGVDRSVSLRRAQAKERSQAQAQILSSQKEIDRLNKERSPIAAQVREVEAEVGPVKYIAQLIYGESQDQSTLEAAVRLVILLIVLVFDPLAVLMFIAVNQDVARKSVSQSTQTEENVNNEKHSDSPFNGKTLAEVLEELPQVSDDFDPRPEVVEEPVVEVKKERKKRVKKEPTPPPAKKHKKLVFKKVIPNDIEQAVEEAVKKPARIDWNPHGEDDLRDYPIKRDF